MQLVRINNIIGYFYVFLLCLDFFNNKRINLKHIFYFMIIAICGLSHMAVGGRTALIAYIVAAFVYFMIFLLISGKKINLKGKLKTIIVSFVVLILFYNILPFLGQEKIANFYDYTSFFAGCSIPTMDYYLNDNSYNISKSDHWGYNTFIGIQEILNKLNIINYNNMYQSEWVSFDIQSLRSNVKTAVYYYIIDFGFWGMCFFAFINGMFFGSLFNKVNNKNNNEVYFIILYGYFALNILNISRGESLFKAIISVNTIMTVIYGYLYFISIKLLNKKDY